MLAPLLDLVPTGTSPALALTALVLAVVVIGIAKSGFGGGIGILATPLIAAAVNPRVAVGVMLPILIAADVVALVQHRRHRSDFHLRWSLLGACVGILLSTALLWYFVRGDADAAQQHTALTTTLNLTVGGVCVVLVILQLYRLAGGRVPRIPVHRRAAVGSGGLAGFVSTLAHAAGPIMTIYILEQNLEKRRVVGTLVLFFFVTNLLKLPTFFALGFINRTTLTASAWLTLLVPVGSLVGFWLHRRIPEKPFAIIMYTGAGAAGAWLVWKGLTA